MKYPFKFLTALAALLAATLPAGAFAYVGPGAGLSLLGALWALVAALGMALLFVVAWPVRKMLRRKRAAGNVSAEERHYGEQHRSGTRG